jgi:hypothetical protein
VTNEKRIGLKIESKWKLAEFGKDGFAMDASNVLLVSHANGTSMLRVFSMARSLSLSFSLASIPCFIRFRVDTLVYD